MNSKRRISREVEITKSFLTPVAYGIRTAKSAVQLSRVVDNFMAYVTLLISKVLFIVYTQKYLSGIVDYNVTQPG